MEFGICLHSKIDDIDLVVNAVNDFQLTTLTAPTMLESGEDLTSDRIVEQSPEPERHYRIHAGHGTYLHPDEVQLATPELIEAGGLIRRLG